MPERTTCKHCGAEIRRYGGSDYWGHVNGVEFNLVTYCRITTAEPADHQIGDREPVVCDHEGGIFEGLDRCADCGAPVRADGSES